TCGRRAAAAVELLRSLNADLLGAVLNRVGKDVRESVPRYVPTPVFAGAFEARSAEPPEIDDPDVNAPANARSVSPSDNSTAIRYPVPGYLRRLDDLVR